MTGLRDLSYATGMSAQIPFRPTDVGDRIAVVDGIPNNWKHFFISHEKRIYVGIAMRVAHVVRSKSQDASCEHFLEK